MPRTACWAGVLNRYLPSRLSTNVMNQIGKRLRKRGEASGAPLTGKDTQAEATEPEWLSVGRMGKGSAQKALGSGWSSERRSRSAAGGATGAGPQALCTQVGRSERWGEGRRAPESATRSRERNPKIYGMGGALLAVLVSRCARAQQN